MIKQSYLKSYVFNGVLKGQSNLSPHKNRGSRSLMFTLTLTSLIDAFTIIVIYLLVNFGNPTQSLKVNGNVELPSAVKNDAFSEGTVVTINNGHYFVEDKEVTLETVTKILVDKIQEKPDQQNLIIQADKRTDYSSLSPIILAGSQAGFHQFKFAVLQAPTTGGTR